MDKPLASLSSGLLARKGQARPAMRPQGFAGFGNLSGAMDDLGWNDMGIETTAAAEIVPVTSALALPLAAAVPSVLRQRAVLRDKVAAEPQPIKSAPVADRAVDAVSEPTLTIPAPVFPVERPLPAPRARADKEKAAFTLRLDRSRHLRLRLATAVTGRSAQVLVTEALDRLVATLPEIEELARQLPDETHEGEAS